MLGTHRRLYYLKLLQSVKLCVLTVFAMKRGVERVTIKLECPGGNNKKFLCNKVGTILLITSNYHITNKTSNWWRGVTKIRVSPDSCLKPDRAIRRFLL